MLASQLKQYIIEPVLKDINLYSPSAVNLLLGTAAQESRMGHYIHQVNGPALGIYQIEPATAAWLDSKYGRYLDRYYNEFFSIEENLVRDLAFQTIVCRLKYYSIKEPIPSDPNNVQALGAYWKKYYNTPLGAGTVEEFVKNYKQFVTP